MRPPQHDRLLAEIESFRATLGLSRRAFCAKIAFDPARYHSYLGKRKTRLSLDLVFAVLRTWPGIRLMALNHPQPAEEPCASPSGKS